MTEITDSPASCSLLLVNARFWSPQSGFLDADSALVKDGRFVRFGEYRDFPRGTLKVVDAENRLVIPGFNDAHVHLLEGGLSLQQVQLRDAADESEFADRLHRVAAGLLPGTWVTGGYWDHQNWPSRRMPTRDLIDRAVPDHPVFVVRLDWHVGVANSLALKLAGVDRHTPDPQGGQFDRDPHSGELTGIVRDEAQKALLRVIPPPTPKVEAEAVERAMRHAASLGVTSVQGQCAAGELALYRRLARENRLTLRYSVWSLPEEEEDFTDLPEDGLWLRKGGVKLFADGSLGAATALVSKPYADPPGSTGLEIYSAEELERLILLWDRRQADVIVHAIGDAAVARTLNAFERCLSQPRQRMRRHRIEHVQVVNPFDRIRFAQLGVVASVQPTHGIDDMRWIADRLGDRQEWSYPLASLLQAGAQVALGTDWTVEPLDPLLTLHAAVWRQDIDRRPPGGWFPGECVSVDQALTLYTLGSAFAERQEHQKGRLQPGYLADFVVLSQDIIADPTAILDSHVELTAVEGRIVYSH
ncbi:amidohydrolase [candidate division KSB1 bacterium]|nr:amidohydrolase [candidate division KSB1 bacterium]